MGGQFFLDLNFWKMAGNVFSNAYEELTYRGLAAGRVPLLLPEQVDRRDRLRGDMKWRKTPEELVKTFQAALPEDARVKPRKMFGYPCAFVNGNMFTGLHQENLIVRLAEEDRQTLVNQKGADSPLEMLQEALYHFGGTAPRVLVK